MYPNAIASGDNPAKLTNAQVGCGYRLIETYRNPSHEEFGFHLGQRQVTVPEVLTQRHGWRAVRWDEVDWALNVADWQNHDVTLDDGTPVAEPPSFRVPITPAFVAWKAKQRPERAEAKRRRDRRISDAEDKIFEAKEDYSLARKAAFFDTAAEYGYVPPGDSFLRMGPGDIRFTADGTDPTETHGSLYWQVVEKPVAQFPPLPAGVKWANRDSMTPEQFEVDKGWRPLCSLDTKWPDDNEFYSSGLGEWVKGGPGATDPRDYIFLPGLLNTYRTRAPIPTA